MMTLPYLADCCIAIKSEVWHCLTVRPMGFCTAAKVRKVCGMEWHSCCGKMVACLFCSADTIEKKNNPSTAVIERENMMDLITKMTMMIYLH